MQTSLVTGGAGFIGSHVVGELLRMGHQVIVLDDLSGGAMENLNGKATFIEGSILDGELLDEIFNSHKIDYIYHLAAYAAEGLSHFIKRFNYQNNVIGSVNLINEAVKHKVKCFVFTSSIAVYGSQVPPMTESMTPLPEDSYGIAKYAVEQELRISKEMFDLDFVIFRPHNVFGERQHIGDKYRNVIGIFMNQLMKGEALTLFGDGNQTRSFTYINDVAPHIAKSVNNSQCLNEIINIGSGQILSVRELADMVMAAMGIQGELKHLSARKEVVHAYSDHAKFLNIFKVDEATDLMDGLKNMAQWALAIGPQEQQKFLNIEIRRNLPDSWN